MAIVFAQADDSQQCTRAAGASEPAFADLAGAAVTASAGAVWAIMFSGMFLIPKAGTVEIQLVADGIVVPGSQRVMDVSAGGLMNERCLTLEGVSQSLSHPPGKVIKVQWRALKGKIMITDRRLTIFQ